VRLVDGIRTVGFRKWYQRELTRSHLSLVVLLLCGVGAMVALELVSRQAPMSDRIGSLVLMLACAAVGAVSLRRYLFLLMRAEQAAREAVCPACATYGRLDLADDAPRRQEADVRCRKCRHVWRMSDAGDE
jgi:predicted Zn finger-like uncharacterized protein